MRLLIVVFFSLVLTSCSEPQQAGNSNSAADLTSNHSELPSSAVSIPNANLASTSAVVPASGIQESTKSEIHSKVIINKPKYAANDPDAPLEVGVIHFIEEFRAVTPPGHDPEYVPMVMPLFSVPKHPKQFPTKEFLKSEQHDDTNSNDVDKFDAIENLTVDDGREMDPEDIKALDEEKVSMRMRLIAEYADMSSIPNAWVNSKGKRYIPFDGGQFGALAMDYAIGFRISNPDISDKSNGQVVLSRPEGFPLARLVPQNEWKQWPEFQQELKKWSIGQLEDCKNLPKCKKATDWLVMPEHIEGEAYEYKIDGGRKLQYIQALSRGKGKGVLGYLAEHSAGARKADELQVSLWRLVNSDGSARVLTNGEVSPPAVSLVDHYCEAQCTADWRGMPTVISWKGFTYVVGASSRGTLHGYVVLEVLPNELKFVGSVDWGS